MFIIFKQRSAATNRYGGFLVILSYTANNAAKPIPSISAATINIAV